MVQGEGISESSPELQLNRNRVDIREMERSISLRLSYIAESHPNTRSPHSPHRARGSKDHGMRHWEVILELGAEGGSVALYGLETEEGWVFSRSVSDWSPELIGEERIQHNSPLVDSWQAAIALLNDYPWQRLSPLMVHPEFSERVWTAVRNRLTNDRASGLYFDSWRSICRAGGDPL